MRINLRPFHSSAGEWRIEDGSNSTVLMPYHESSYPVDKLCMLAGNASRMYSVLKQCQQYLAYAPERELVTFQEVLSQQVNDLLQDCTRNKGQYDDK